MNVLEVGLEKELWLLRGDEIIEPSLLNFPVDIFGFLVEIRSLPSDRAYPVITTLYEQELQYQLRSNKFGMKLFSYPYKFANKEFFKYIEKKYKIHDYPDLTQNIYGEKKSHHLGIFPVEETANPITKEVELYRLTAGIHVHFSSRDSETGKPIELPTEYIVNKMDIAFKKDIERTCRIKGEWEPKPNYGFEYRSLPNDVDIVKVVKEAFRILRSV